MSPDPMARVLLALILACLVVLVIQGFADDRASPGAVSLALPEAETELDAAIASTDPKPAVPPKKKKKSKQKPSAKLKPPVQPPLPKARPVTVNPQTELEALGHALTPENPQSIRIWAAEQLGTQPGGQGVTVLAETLGDSDSAVVVAAIRALRDSKDPRARGSIEPLLKHADPSVQKAARQALESP